VDAALRVKLTPDQRLLLTEYAAKLSEAVPA
jgi:hypothetical protein